jgi:hypothetical protein
MKKYDIKFYILCNGDGYIDNWCKKYYEDLGCFYTTSKEKSQNNKYYSIYKDFIIQCEYPKWLVEEIDEVYKKAKDFNSFDAQKLAKILLKESNVRIMVMRNPLIAEQMGKIVLDKFRKS